jgi:hypothetical protein
MSTTSPDAIAATLRAAASAGRLSVPVEGTSMGKSIAAGATVGADPDRRPRIGDVVVFVDASGRIVVHRFCGAVRGDWRFRGDGNPMTVQERVPPSQVVGVACDARRDDEPLTLRRRYRPVLGWAVGRLLTRLRR